MAITYDELVALGQRARSGELESVPASTVEVMVDFYEACLADRNGWKETWARTQKKKIAAEREAKEKSDRVATFLESHRELSDDVREFLESLH